MKVALLLSLALVVVAASPATTKAGRRYDPTEEDMYRTKYLLVEDGEGKYRVEDLTIPGDYKASASDVTFYLYTQSNTGSPNKIPGTQFDALSSSNFKASRQNVFIAHGWNNNYESSVNVNIKSALLASHDLNVFVVDWSGPANEFYTSAKDAVPDVGNVIAQFINYMISNHGVNISSFTLIGHSLGAHVVGCAGAALNGQIPVIIGLDPAGPLFTVGNIDNRIDDTDAKFVHIIHTSLILGFSSALGDSDYYPNGGKTQDGCGLDVAGTCAHSRAYLYYAESIAAGIFTARNCDSQSNYENGSCNDRPASKMGQLNVDKTAHGDFYLSTNTDSPFALG